MRTRIFISYRTADGVDKATALARDLGEIFGDEAVFLDKDDLRGGTAWRQEIHRALDARPILLLLVTPLLLNAVDDQGRVRIADDDDPVRKALQAALEAGASVIPLLCDGLDEVPDASRLPAPFERIGDLTWRKLRAYDWDNDIERLSDDLKASGIPAINRNRRAGDAAPTMAHYARTRRRVMALVAGAVGLIVAASAWWLTHERSPTRLSGRWQAQLWQGERVAVDVAEQGHVVTLSSAPIAIADRPDWAEYRRFWREQGKGELSAIRYRGEGRRIDAPGAAAILDIALLVLPGPDAPAVDSGNLRLHLAADGKTLAGRIWLNGAQADQAAVLTRLPR